MPGPPGEGVESGELLVGDGGVLAAGADVEQEVPALGGDVGGHVEQLAVGQELLRPRHPVVAEALVHAPDALPRCPPDVVEHHVLGGLDVEERRLRWDEAALGAGGAGVDRIGPTGDQVVAGGGHDRRPRHPPVVDHPVGHGPVVLGEQRPQVLARRRPGDVVPQDAGSVPLDQLTDLRRRVVRVRAAGDGREHGAEVADRAVVEGPVEAAGVVDAEAHPGGAHRLAQLADDVAAGVPARAVRVGDRRRPQAEPVVVLGDQDHVAGAGRREGPGPVVGVPAVQALAVEVGQLGVRHEAVGLAVVPARRAVREPQRVLVPLGVGVLRQRLGVTGREQVADVGVDRSEPRHRRRGPVHEDPQLGVGPPRRHPVTSQVLQVGSGAHVGHPARSTRYVVRDPGVRLDLALQSGQDGVGGGCAVAA